MSDHHQPAGSSRTRIVGAVDHALALLVALQDHPSLAVRESAALLGVAPSTAHRLLVTMQQKGFVVQDPESRRYGPGPALLAIALASLQRVDVGRVVRPHLSALAAETRETASLVVPEGANVRFIDSVEGPEVVRVTSRAGVSIPAYASAAGKVLLASATREEVFRLYPSSRLPRRAPRTITSRAALLKELDRVRRTGYASSNEEGASGLAGVAVGIRDVRGRTIAALTVSVPAERLDDARVARLGAAARRRADRVEAEISAAHGGHSGSDGR